MVERFSTAAANADNMSVPELDGYLDRVRPFVDDTIDKLGSANFREDPIAGRTYSRTTSIISSAYKRHGAILDQALLERLKDCARLRVWTEDDFKLSHESLQRVRISERIEPLLMTELPYGDRERSIRVDIIVFDEDRRSLTSYNVKRGNGSYDGGKRRMIQEDLNSHAHASCELWALSRLKPNFKSRSYRFLLWSSFAPSSAGDQWTRTRRPF